MTALIYLKMIVVLSGVEFTIFVQVLIYLALDNLTFLMARLMIVNHGNLVLLLRLQALICRVLELDVLVHDRGQLACGCAMVL